MHRLYHSCMTSLFYLKCNEREACRFPLSSTMDSASGASAHFFLLLLQLLITLNLLLSHNTLVLAVEEPNSSVLLPIMNDDPAGIRTYTVFLEVPEVSQKFRGTGLGELEDWHRSFLPNATLDSGEPRLVYSYRHTFSGFVARLTPDEAAAMAAMEGFLDAVVEDGVLELHTTYTPKYLGLRSRLSGDWTFPNKGEGMVIGVVDTGIIHTHASFYDTDVPDPPARFAGRCGPDASYCNKKIVRAVSFPFRDTDPVPLDFATKLSKYHGTHVASIAAGNFVGGVSVNGARSKAIASGMAPMAHLAIYQMCQKSSCDVNNTGVAFDQAVGDEVDVINLSAGGPPTTLLHRSPSSVASFHAFKSGIVTVASAGNRGPAAGTVGNIAPWHITVGNSMTDRRIYPKRDDYGIKPNPKVYYESARGPVPLGITGNIMKPDVIAPGYDILGASPLGQPSNAAFVEKTGTSMATPHVAGIAAVLKKSHPDWSPAAVKSALMTTADMLDADGNAIIDDEGKGKATLHAMGAGQVNPTKANDPGLVYNMTEHDYYPYLCGLGYQNWQMRKFSQRPIYCNNFISVGAEQLNLPSIALSLPSQNPLQVKVQRTATNVGEAGEEYTASVITPDKVHVHVHPHKLKFKDKDEEKTFSVEFKKHHHHSPSPGSFSEGHLIWTSHKHVVRSPILIRFT